MTAFFNVLTALGRTVPCTGPAYNTAPNISILVYTLHCLLKQNINFGIDESYQEIALEIALEGKIDKLVELAHKYLENLSNRDYVKFDEKYVKLIFYCIAMNLKIFRLKSEMEVQRKYPDILLIPTDKSKDYKAVMIEFKYLKKEESNLLQKKQEKESLVWQRRH